jgi:phosphoribosylanthranilate isomerase
MLEENFIQIAGMIDAAEAEMLQHCDIPYLGFPLRLPVHREDLTEEEVAAIIQSPAGSRAGNVQRQSTTG